MCFESTRKTRKGKISCFTEGSIEADQTFIAS